MYFLPFKANDIKLIKWKDRIWYTLEFVLKLKHEYIFKVIKHVSYAVYRFKMNVHVLEIKEKKIYENCDKNHCAYQ